MLDQNLGDMIVMGAHNVGRVGRARYPASFGIILSTSLSSWKLSWNTICAKHIALHLGQLLLSLRTVQWCIQAM